MFAMYSSFGSPIRVEGLTVNERVPRVHASSSFADTAARLA